MKATIDIPDDLYRRVKAKSALEGRPIRAVAIELFQSWLDQEVGQMQPGLRRRPTRRRRRWLRQWIQQTRVHLPWRRVRRQTSSQRLPDA